MIKVLFVCLGNICRSPMAEFILKDMVKKLDLESQFIIQSAGTINEEAGNDIYPSAKNKLKVNKIEYTKHSARKMNPDDYKYYDYIIGMERKNVENIIKIVGNDPEKKVSRLLDFSVTPRDIADPYFTGDFDTAFNEIEEGCKGFLAYCLKQGEAVRSKIEYQNKVKEKIKNTVKKQIGNNESTREELNRLLRNKELNNQKRIR